MKKLLLLISFCMAIQGCVSNNYPIRTDSGSNHLNARDVQPMTFTFRDIDADKDTIYKRAMDFFVSSYGDSREVIHSSDKDAGVIVGHGVTDEWLLYNDGIMAGFGTTEYKITFIAKDGRARVQFELLDMACSSYEYCPGMPTKKSLPEVKRQINELAQSIKNALKNGSSIDEISDF